MATQITDKCDGLPHEADLFLLICNMFPKVSRIPIEDLVIYGMGLKLFDEAQDMFGARERVHHLIDTINSNDSYRNKKFDYEKEDYSNKYVRLNVSADDLASIASRCQLVFSREIVTEEWPETNRYRDCYGLSLVLKKVSKYPVHLDCPKLALLQLQHKEDSQIPPVDFVEGMKELRVLSLDVPSLPQSFNFPRFLQTLHLKLRKLEDISAIGGLVNLGFLSISTLSSSDVPHEIGELANLRLLDLSKMNIAYIPPGVLRRMLKLEELYLPISFRGWGCVAKAHDYYDEQKSRVEDNNVDEERVNASLGEIRSLSLKALQISVPNASVLPRNSPVFKNIQRFKILVPNNLEYQPFDKGSVNELQLMGDVWNIKESGISDLMIRTEDLSLTRVRNLKSINIGMYQIVGNDLRHVQLKMLISECDELEYIVDTSENWDPVFSLFWKLKSLHLSMLPNLKVLWHGKKLFGWFTNLRQISIRFCHKLKFVFQTSIVNELKKLQSIEILDCSEMEGIFQNKVDKDVYGAYLIKELVLHSLPKFVGFLTLKDNVVHGVNDGTNQSLTTNEVSLVKEDTLRHMEMYSAFSSESSLRLISLKKLKIVFCDALRVIFSFQKEHAWAPQLHYSLKELELYGLRNLMHVWFQIPPNIKAFGNLQLSVLTECHNLYLLSPQIAKHLVQLQKIQISRCEKMKEVIEKEDYKGGPIKDTIVFPKLKDLELQHMPNLRIFYGGISAIEFPSLESLKFNQCNEITSFSCGALKTPILEGIQMNGSSYLLAGDLNATIKRHAYMSSWTSLPRKNRTKRS